MPAKPAHTHNETVDYDKQGRCLGTCQLCGQVREYDPEGRKPPLVIKEGSMDQTAKGTSNTANIRQRRIRERHTYIEQHKPEILHDLEALGLKGCLAKWQIPTSTWGDVKRRWGLMKRKLTKLSPTNPQGAPAGSPAGEPDNSTTRPAFPPFNEAWAPEIKVAWLEAYVKLFGGNGAS